MDYGRDLRHMMLEGYAAKIDAAHKTAVNGDPTEQVVLVLDLTDPIARDIARLGRMPDAEIEKQLAPCIGNDRSAIVCVSMPLVGIVEVVGTDYPAIADRLAAGRPDGSYAVIGVSDGGVTIRDVYPMKPE